MRQLFYLNLFLIASFFAARGNCSSIKLSSDLRLDVETKTDKTNLNCTLASGTYDVCSGINLSTDNGINTSNNGVTWQADTAYIQKVDSMSITLKASGCIIYVSSITINGSEMPYVISGYLFGPRVIRLLSIPGHYEVFAIAKDTYVERLRFDLILNPVSIDETPILENEIRVFPNPTRACANVISERIPLSYIQILNSDLKQISLLPVENKKIIEIPLNDLPPSIYYLKIGTLTGRTSIRKLIVN